MSQERALNVCIDPEFPELGNFGLYYFRTWHKRWGITDPSTMYVLFIAGGPGETPDQALSKQRFLTALLRAKDENAEAVEDRDVPKISFVYFHLRGSGLSQLPRHSRFDRFLRARFVLADIESIRKSIHEDLKWGAVFGHSYGSVIAQMYAAHNRAHVERLILSQPISRHMFARQDVMKVDETFRLYNKGRSRRLCDALAGIYGWHPRFAEVNDQAKEQILSAVEAVRSAITKEFHSASFLLESYDDEITDPESPLHKKPFIKPHDGQPYCKEFFIALQALKKSGWLPADNGTMDMQEDVGLVLGAEVVGDQTFATIALDKRDIPPKRFLHSPHLIEFARRRFLQQGDIAEMMAAFAQEYRDARGPHDNLKDPELSSKIQTGLVPGSQFGLDDWSTLDELRNNFRLGRRSKRAYYVFGAYDGIHASFLKEFGRTKDLELALRASSGHDTNPSIDRVGIAHSESPKAWDPAEHSHRVPTLILTGNVDPVTAPLDEGTGDAKSPMPAMDPEMKDPVSYIFANALKGPKIWIDLPGVGHGLEGVRTENTTILLLRKFFESIDFAGFGAEIENEQELRNWIDRIARSSLAHYYFPDRGDVNEVDVRKAEWTNGLTIRIAAQG